ncbi:MAG: DUF4298 domain-containing protein [Treponema sp.]|nr:DUF4298 domain-containing protein [Treponema sp.]
MTRIDRIRQMERYLDVSVHAFKKLDDALSEYEAALPSYLKLTEYYGSAQWMKDYKADEAGKLPQTLKRGVLSEDAVYDLLADTRSILVRMLKVVTALS